MRRLVPATLFGQTLAVSLAGLVISALLGIAILAFNQTTMLRTMGAYAATQRIVNLARLIDEVPQNWRTPLIKAASSDTVRIALLPHRPVWVSHDATGTDARMIRIFLARQLPPDIAASLHVEVGTAFHHGEASPRGMMAMMGSSAHQSMRMAMPHIMPMMQGALMPGMGDWRALRVAMMLPHGRWVAFTVALPSAGFGLAWPFLIALIAMALIVIPASIWAVGRVTAPLRTLATAAERLGRDVTAPPLAETGTIETRQAAHAFNVMQSRLRHLVESRTRMLAALSHDLRTPLTLLQLRVEDVPQAEERDRMLATIAGMNQMIEATLAFARDDAAVEPFRRIDLTALLAAIVDDMADAGMKAILEPAPSITVDGQPAALRRALVNLLDNAIKYGGAASVTVGTGPHTAIVRIDDAGPGIPPAELARVFEPFYRVERSRSAETGGSGLGLSIAMAVMQAHGGTITLSNRSEGGLSALVVLSITA
ncbi:ATP-binding protein [Acidiphilium acidophilum]|uniref:ATP-binding protein n=1 Tax=Acidiphilium acidophilum TaxID=76588 RepID=UPI002E8E62B0|nr:ATP-binding protein [Acidiphilium acidophilum]